ncbi:MAG: phenylacetate-CoA oxygenase subunit PaaI [Deltaproteobacteria bacterium]|nr:phenylacetate-CoA oxygenase subunit PaaI [Deltaproteobacteria bacterium]
MARIATFDDWIALFRQWQRDIGYDPALIGNYTFEARFADTGSPAIEFGRFRGERKWERLEEVSPGQVRDDLLRLVVYQGDTELASVEQQRNPVQTCPSAHDLKSLARVNREEMRHGWQMAYLLVTCFGETGRAEALKLLERRADQNRRLLGAFNEPVENWIDFYCYTEFVARDGRYQLTMLSHSAFAPLARSMPPMLEEEKYHLFTGNTGLMRILKAGRIPSTLIQKYFNRWIPVSLDLFGKDSSASALRFYEEGLKGRYDEDPSRPADLAHLNEHARELYVRESQALLDALNELIPPDQPRLRIPDPKFRRSIGEYVGQPYSVDGDLLTPAAYERHLAEVLPGPEDRRRLESIFKEPDWILPVATA